jgi:hypothetical protein
MHSVTQRKRDEWKHSAPTLRRFSANATEDVFDNAIDALCLTVGMRMVHCGHVQLGGEHLKDSVLDLPSEAGVSIRDNRYGQPVLAEDPIDKQLCCIFTVNGVRHCR